MNHKKNELRITFIGTPSKSVIFDQLKESALKTEKHVSYQDTFYFTFNVDDCESVVELVDPGTEHTGAREMSIRRAEGAMLFYSAYSISSFRQISELVNDFSYRKHDNKLPVLLVCIEDELVDDSCETSSTTRSSTSEGYESETPHLVPSERRCNMKRPSMEKFRSSHEQGKLSREKGEELAREISPNCKFLPITLASFHESAKLMEDMIREIRNKQSKKHSRFSHGIIQRNQKVQASGERHKLVTNSKNSSVSTTSTQKSTKKKIVSAVCTIS